MTLKRRKKQKTGLRQESRIRSYAHKKWVRGFECLIAGKHGCVGIIQAAHVRTGTDGYMGEKPSDCYVVPLCVAAHTEQHSIGEKSFERVYGVNFLGAAEELWRKSPHRRAAELKEADEIFGETAKMYGPTLKGLAGK